MNDLHDLVSPGAAVAGLIAPSKKLLFPALAAITERVYGIDAGVAIDCVTERERLGSTGFGGGIAIPHGKIDGLDRIAAVVARLATPIDYGAIDDLPVDLVVMLLSPADAGADHLKALARISRRLRDRAQVAKLRGASSDDALYALLADTEARDAA